MSEKYSKKYPRIDNLLCIYFDQDWDEFYPNERAVISYFVRSNKYSWIKSTINELKMLLKEKHTIQKWEDIIYSDFDCQYRPDATINPKEWLEEVLEQLERELPLAEED